ncbi:hypothetical protein M885DRAFT_623607 [Pelagophyceae sp. CCMP2097]|nr:hypothetical protein M885DRAFT_623607 [Pelagophyceae sp. CCMP2097]
MVDPDRPLGKATSCELYAAASLLSTVCKDVNVALIQCKIDSPCPSSCLAQGIAVQKCGDALIARLEETVGEQYAALKICFDDSNSNFHTCKAQKAALQAAWDALPQ